MVSDALLHTRRTAWVLAALCVFAGAQAHAQDASAGKKVYERVCAECHGKDARGGSDGAGPPILPFPHEVPGMISIARAGKGEMAAFPRKVISDQEVTDVVAYLKALGGPPAK